MIIDFKKKAKFSNVLSFMFVDFKATSQDYLPNVHQVPETLAALTNKQLKPVRNSYMHQEEIGYDKIE